MPPCYINPEIRLSNQRRNVFNLTDEKSDKKIQPLSVRLDVHTVKNTEKELFTENDVCENVKAEKKSYVLFFFFLNFFNITPGFVITYFISGLFFL